MLSRLSTSTFLGICVTFALFFFMQLMIITQKDLPRDIERIIPSIFVPREVTPPETRPPPTPRPEQVITPPQPPTLKVGKIDKPILTIDNNHPTVLPAPPGPKAGIGFADGDIQLRAAIQPVYPQTLLSREIEGYVVVSFDVTKFGTIQNPLVLESSNRGFEKAALNAIRHFKYKPRMIDGEAVAVSGVQYKFSFKMEP